MVVQAPATSERLQRVVEAFWESFPPFWCEVRAHIRTVAAEHFGITVEQFHILRHIHRGRGSVSELADAKQTSRAATSQAVDALVTKGLVARAQVARDRRHVQLTLTPAGSDLLDAVFGETRRWMMEALGSLNEDEIWALLQGLDALKKVVVEPANRRESPSMTID